MASDADRVLQAFLQMVLARGGGDDFVPISLLSANSKGSQGPRRFIEQAGGFEGLSELLAQFGVPGAKEVASLILAGQHIEMLEQHDAAQARSAAEAAATVTPEDADAAPRAVDCSPRRLSAASAAAAARSPLSPRADPGNRGTNPPAADPPPQRPPAGPG
jgi:hypothetical protein